MKTLLEILSGAGLLVQAIYLVYTAHDKANLEATEIQERQLADDRRDLDHRKLWMRRAGPIVIAILVGSVMGLPAAWPMTWQVVIPRIMFAWGIFAIEHRMALNDARGLPDTYISGGNYYDKLFIRIGGTPRNGAIAEYTFESLLIAGGLFMAWAQIHPM